MFREIVFCAMVFCGVQRSESAITGWSGGGTITGADGTITLTSPLSEDSAVGTTVVSLTAASDGTVTGYSVTGTPDAADVSSTGVVTLKAQVDYEANAELVLLVVADDGSATGTATVTVPIGDVGPFTTTTKELCVKDGLGPGESVGDVSATGVDTYTTTDTTFAVDSTSGAVTTTASVTLNKATTDEYTVPISGAVTGGESNILTLTVKVGDCSGKEKMAAALGSLLLSLLAYTLLSM
ncbi:protocadherin-16-like [Mya arenaria]|uniref:protocadherin-16-like n=1 Tax=Mya arenaria TaxID=6604 RepID=UPI0022DF8772|nr:protocadherin-16-like [Mya arenaria]